MSPQIVALPHFELKGIGVDIMRRFEAAGAPEIGLFGGAPRDIYLEKFCCVSVKPRDYDIIIQPDFDFRLDGGKREEIAANLTRFVLGSFPEASIPKNRIALNGQSVSGIHFMRNKSGKYRASNVMFTYKERGNRVLVDLHFHENPDVDIVTQHIGAAEAPLCGIVAMLSPSGRAEVFADALFERHARQLLYATRKLDDTVKLRAAKLCEKIDGLIFRPLDPSVVDSPHDLIEDVLHMGHIGVPEEPLVCRSRGHRRGAAHHTAM